VILNNAKLKQKEVRDSPQEGGAVNASRRTIRNCAAIA